MNHPELKLRVVVSSRWGKPSSEWAPLCGEDGVGFGADPEHPDAWEPPFAPPTVVPPTVVPPATPETPAKTPPKKQKPKPSTTGTKREAKVAAAAKITKLTAGGGGGVEHDTSGGNGAGASTKGADGADKADKGKWRDGRTVKSVLQPPPANMKPKQHVTHKPAACKVERNTVGFVRRSKNVVAVHVAEVGVMTTGKNGETASRYAIVCESLKHCFERTAYLCLRTRHSSRPHSSRRRHPSNGARPPWSCRKLQRLRPMSSSDSSA